jgi:hypothetical protein
MNEQRKCAPRLAPLPDTCLGQKRRALRSWLLVAPILIAAPTSFAQIPRDLPAKSSANPILPKQDLDFSGERLPSQFLPVDPAELYEAASRTLVASEKSEFETTAQYQARIAALLRKPLLHGLSGNDDFAFVLKPSARSISGSLPKQHDFLTVDFLETTYDADSRQMSVSLPTDGGEIGSEYKWVSAMHRSVASGAPYVGQNAFGVRRLVRRVKTNTLELEVEDYDWLAPDWTDDGTDKVFSLTIGPDEARALSEDIEVIMIGKLRPPFTSNSVDGTDPSLEQLEPTDITRVHRLLHIVLDQVIIADSRTGAILKQFNRKNHQAAFPVTVEFRGEDAPFSDIRCTENAYLFPFNILSIDYSLDGGTQQHALLNEPVRIEARQYVDLSIRYCDVSRVKAFVGGRPYKLICQYQEQYIADNSKCARIQIESAQQSPSSQ